MEEKEKEKEKKKLNQKQPRNEANSGTQKPVPLSLPEDNNITCFNTCRFFFTKNANAEIIILQYLL